VPFPLETSTVEGASHLSLAGAPEAGCGSVVGEQTDSRSTERSRYEDERRGLRKVSPLATCKTDRSDLVSQ